MANANPLPAAGGSVPTALHGCPDRQELIAFNQGTLPLAFIKSVAAHIKECPLCEAHLSTLQADHDETQRPPPGPAEKVNVQLVDSAHSLLVDLPIDFSLSGPGRLAKGSSRILDAPLQLGQYRLMEKIGQGGMGVVYKAWHDRLKREVAIKLLPLDQLDDPQGIDRLQREMAAAGNLRHANVVFATDAGESEGVHFLVMEYVQGIDLARLVSRAGPLPVPDACELVRQAAIGLEHIYKTGLVHRDLKPSNLMLAVDGTVKIMDLGLARLRPDLAEGDEAHSPRCLMGTIDYVSPEQSRDARDADIRSDIYSLGCTLYKLLRGQPPFSGQEFETVQEKLHGHRKLPPPSISVARPDIPAVLEAILARTLAKQPEDRYSTPRELAAALEPLAKTSNLSLLLQKACLQPQDVGEIGLPEASNTPSTVSILNASEGSVEALQPKSAGQAKRTAADAWYKLAAAVGLMLAIALGATGVSRFFGATSGISSSGDREATSVSPSGPADLDSHPGANSPIQPASTVPNPTAAKIWLSKDIETRGEYQWEGFRAKDRHITFLDSPPAIMVGSSCEQLIQLGRYPGGPGKIYVTIDQTGSQFEGHCGVFLGAREEKVSQGNISRRMTVFQLIWIRRLGHPNTMPYTVGVFRQKVAIDPDNLSWIRPVRDCEQVVEWKKGDYVYNLEITFEKEGIESIALDGQLLKELTAPGINELYDIKDFSGVVGLYNMGERGTKFSNIEITPLEPLR